MTDRPTPPRGTVLLVDNDDGVLKALSTRLENAGYACQTARSGLQGVAQFDPDRVDLIVTDLNMPALDGFGVIRRVREISDVPVLIITGFRREYAQALGSLRNVLLFEKPFSVNNLIEVIETEVFMRQRRNAA